MKLHAHFIVRTALFKLKIPRFYKTTTLKIPKLGHVFLHNIENNNLSVFANTQCDILEPLMDVFTRAQH